MMRENQQIDSRSGPQLHRPELLGRVDRKTRPSVLLLIALLHLNLSPMRVHADDEFPPVFAGEEAIVFQEIPSVYGASKFEQKVTEAPSFVSLITADEIAKYGYRTMAEILQSVTGFFVTYDRNYNYLGIRGFNRPGDFNSRVLLLVDGHRLNDNIYDQAGLGTESLIDVDLIERVEVIRGASSSLYGTNAFFGVINVITKRGRDIRGMELSGEVGSFGYFKGRVTYGDKFSNGIELLLSGSYFGRDGEEVLYFEEFYDPDLPGADGTTTKADDDEYPSLFAKLSFRDITLQGGFVSREKGIPTASYGTFFPTARTRSLDQHFYTSLKYEHQLEHQINFSGRVYYDRFYYRGDYLYDYALDPDVPDLVLNQDKSTGEWWGTEIKFDKRILDVHNLTAGFEYQGNFRQDLKNADKKSKTVYLNEKRDTQNWAFFLQDEFSILDNLILNAGVRFDHYGSFGGTWNPRAALIYNFERSTIKALYGQAFRAPNAYERFYEGTGFKANPDLDAEKIATYELVFEHSLTDHLRATAAAYFYTIDDLISLESDGPDEVFKNRGKTESMGLELQLEMDDRGPLGVAGRVGYALQKTEDRRTKKRLTNSPAHLLNLNAIIPMYEDKLFAGLEILYTSKRKTLAGATTKDYSTTNLTIFSKNVLKGLEVSTSVRNLFGANYSDPGSAEHVQDAIDQDGRSFWLKIKYGF